MLASSHSHTHKTQLLSSTSYQVETLRWEKLIIRGKVFVENLAGIQEHVEEENVSEDVNANSDGGCFLFCFLVTAKRL